jgi:hypothetical protein
VVLIIHASIYILSSLLTGTVETGQIWPCSDVEGTSGEHYVIDSMNIENLLIGRGDNGCG